MTKTLWDEFQRCRPWMEKSLELAQGDEKIQDVWLGLVEGRYKIYAGETSVIVTHVYNTSHNRICRHCFAGGDKNELVNVLEPKVEQDAKILNCDFLEIAGRKGWSRVMAPHGYKFAYEVIRKPLENVR